MNHGIVCRLTEAVSAYVWDLAMSRGQFVALYTVKRSSDLWLSTVVRSIGEPVAFDPLGLGQQPGFRHPTGEYARYEPEYDQQFVKMVEHCTCNGDLTPVLPATVSDQEAVWLLGKMHSVKGQVHEKFYDQQPLDKRPTSERRLRDLFRPIRLSNGWAFCLGVFHYTTPIVLFLADNPADIEALSERVKEDRLYNGLFEEW
jgi:hypothetical protein